jgi:cytoskeleton-associated protein 5
LKPVQQKELGESFEAADRGEKEEYGFGRLKPSRLTLSGKKELARREAEGQLNGGSAEDGDEGEEGAEEGAFLPFFLSLDLPYKLNRPLYSS